jgi:hypothetical protein
MPKNELFSDKMKKVLAEKRGGIQKVNRKFKTKEDFNTALDKLCTHLSSGLSTRSFYGGATFETMRKYIENYPETFVTTKGDKKEQKLLEEEHIVVLEKLEQANIAYEMFWEEIGQRGTKGHSVDVIETDPETGKKTIKRQSFNATAWIFNMKNRFNWKDKTEVENTGVVKVVKISVEQEKDEQ